MRKLTAKLFLIALVALIGVALKAQRYGVEANDVAGEALTHASRVMAEHGWAQATPQNQASTPYLQRAFTRVECPQPVIVAVLEGNAEGAQFFRARYGGDAAFLQDKLVEQPSGLRRQVTGMVRDLKRMGGFSTPRPLPVLAIAPAPTASPSLCDGPPARAWRR